MATTEFLGVGKRKTSIARVKLVPGKGRLFVNNKTIVNYFGNRPSLKLLMYQPLVLTENETKFDIKVKVVGGGNTSQADAIRYGISKALLEVNPENKAVLRAEGLLTRDARIKERKKYGQKRARKKFQFSKR